MKITKTHVQKYLALRSDVKQKEETMTELKTFFLDVIHESGKEKITTPAGNVALVVRETRRLDEAKLCAAFGLDNLDAFKVPTVSESVLVTSA